ncbi:EamA family transporter [Gallaecimonas kandeliae]|uniref:DMT family transporter n=1 Tax=Gallaecimonas kandeliae TaxID=3029055 RepID=UPI002649D5AB|nr:EamA family transporter [Gallaecimonas kandeliae]WKE65364.1 EamA family transporter [Gallaecimonas kandeliae]
MLKNYLFLWGVGLIWGSQFLFQQKAVAALPPVWVGAGRAMVGCMTLVALCYFLKLKASKRQWGKYHLIGFLEATLPFVAVAWGQQYLDTAVAAILMGTIPFFAILLSPLLVKGARITAMGLLSVAVGFAGLLVLFAPELGQGVNASFWGAMAIIGASACFALALLLLKRLDSEEPLIVARNVLLAASNQLVLLALLTAPLDSFQPTGPALGAVAYLGVMCAGVVYLLYMILIQKAGPVFASLSNYLVPLVGVILAATLNQEQLGSNTWVALAVILSAVAINQLGERKAQ